MLSALQTPWYHRTVYSHLVLGVRWEVFTVKVRSDDDPPRGLRILRRDDIREGLESVRSLVRESILFYMPLELLQRADDIIPDLGTVRGVRCLGVRWFRTLAMGLQARMHLRGLGIRILDR